MTLYVHNGWTVKGETSETRQSKIYYAGLLGRWDKQIVDQASDVPSIIFFHKILQNSLQKPFYFIFFIYFFQFTRMKIKSFECPKSIRNYEKKRYLECKMLGRLVVCPIGPANQRIILLIVGFLKSQLNQLPSANAQLDSPIAVCQ